MILRFIKLISFLFLLNSLSIAHAAAPKVGKIAAAKYFEQNPEHQGKESRDLASADDGVLPEDRYLAFGLSSFTKSDTFNWGSSNNEQNIGKLGLDMTYRLSESNYIDYGLRVLYTEYEPRNQKVNKISFMSTAILPDAGSKFPLYFGAAAGLGVFFSQLKDESPVALDYQIFLGLRIFNLFESTGFYLEGGIKNHLQLTSDGQLNGMYISSGAVFTF